MGGAFWGISTLFSGADVANTAGTAGLANETAGSIVEVATNRNPDEATADEQNIAAPEGSIDSTPPQTNGLPPSTNANNALGIGQRVRVVPGSALTLRTQPGADAGEAVGFLQNAQEATIVGGPHWIQGLSDTIVWWRVELDDGRQAWAPANDSQFTLLEPAPRG